MRDVTLGETDLYSAGSTITVKGIAWGGGGLGVARVDVSVDNGEHFTRAELLDKPIKENRKSQWSWQFFEQTVPLSDGLRWININTDWNVIRMHFRKRLLAGEKVEVVLTSKENLASFVITHFMIRFQSDFT